jgi:hypothetical protein
MRTLSEQELKLVQTDIIAKEISVMEILAEVYDHYISHLEGFSEKDFENELSKLDSKWTNLYCLSLQDEFIKTSDRSLKALHWKLIKSYFTWPKIISTILFFGALYGLSLWITPKVFAFSTIIPAILLFHIFNFSLFYSSRKKYVSLRKIFNLGSRKFDLNYAETNSLCVALATLLALPNIIIYGPKAIESANLGISTNLILLFLSFIAFLMSIISFSAYEAWKIKTKTALS